MSILSFLKYSKRERSMADLVATWLVAVGYPRSDAKSLAYELLSKCVAEADQKGLRSVTDLGERMSADPEFMRERLAAGLTSEDVRQAWGNGYVWVRLQDEVSGPCNFPLYRTLVEDQGLSSIEAVRRIRSAMPFFGDPETSHRDYVGEDADLYFEFRNRFDRWRERYDSAAILAMAREFSTYNAMVRHYIRQGAI